MRVLSVNQPWAALVVHGVKDIENRSWRTHHRGALLIHAAQRRSRRSLADVCAQYSVAITPALEALCELRGGILGQVAVVDCVESHSSPWFDGTTDSKGKRNFAFVLSDARVLPFRPMPGRLGIWPISDFVTPGVTPA